MLYMIISVIAWILCTILFVWAYKEDYATGRDIFFRYVALIFLTAIFLYKGGIIG